MNFNNRERFTFGDITEIIFSGGTPSTRVDKYWGGDINWLSSGETRNNFINTTEKTITKEGVKNSSTRLAKKGDIVMASAGQGFTRGQVSYLHIDTYINQSIIAIRPNPNILNNLYAYYNLKNRYEELRAMSDGHSIRGSITIPMIKELEIDLPPILEQKEVANILSSLDSKIELNNKINNNLEELAQTLYKHWFVDFEFPNEEGLPYKSSGGKMVESEHGLIPEGWEVKNLNSLVKQYRIKSNPNENEKLIDLANMPGYSLTLDSYDYGDKLKTNIYEMKKNNILYGSIRPYLGKFGIAPFDGLTTGTIHQFLPINNSEYSAVSTLVFSKEFNDFCIKLSYGTKMPVINWKQLGTYKVIYNNDLFEKFNEITKSYYENIVKNINENIKLRNIRDLLLPKLMSGEIRVPVEE